MFLIIYHFFFQKYFVSYIQIVSSEGSASLFIESYGCFFLKVMETMEQSCSSSWGELEKS